MNKYQWDELDLCAGILHKTTHESIYSKCTERFEMYKVEANEREWNHIDTDMMRKN